MEDVVLKQLLLQFPGATNVSCRVAGGHVLLYKHMLPRVTGVAQSGDHQAAYLHHDQSSGRLPTTGKSKVAMVVFAVS
jgi:hypothetical protein